jgi:pyruvate dehydrogenase (quinone)/pyruvate oxidase
MLVGELATCVKYGLDVKVVVNKNNVLGQIKWEQIVFLGNPEYVCELQPVDFAAIARGFGVAGYSIEDPADCARVLGEALAAPGPAVIEAVVDPHEPPMPPKATLKQVSNLAKSLAEGTPARGKIALTVASDIVREIV